MRRYILLALVSILLLSVLVFGTMAVAAEKSPFVGVWEGIDVHDGSYQIMQIRGGGGQYMVIIQDSLCSGCGESEPACKAIGQGTISGGVLTADLTVYAIGCPSCVCQGANPTIEFTYDSGEITDSIGNTWTPV